MIRSYPVFVVEHFGLDSTRFAALGAINRPLHQDLRLYFEPAVLPLPIPEFEDAHLAIQAHFSQLIRRLQIPMSRFDLEALADELQYDEVPGVGLGYSHGHTKGQSMKESLRIEFLTILQELVQAGSVGDHDDIVLTSQAGKGFGPDHLSDIILSILLPRVYRYSERIFLESGLRASQTRQFSPTVVPADGLSPIGALQFFSLPPNPFDESIPVLLLPRQALRRMEDSDRLGRALVSRFREIAAKSVREEAKRAKAAGSSVRKVYFLRLGKDVRFIVHKAKKDLLPWPLDEESGLVQYQVFSLSGLLLDRVWKAPQHASPSAVIEEVLSKVKELLLNPRVGVHMFRTGEGTSSPHEEGWFRDLTIGVLEFYLRENQELAILREKSLTLPSKKRKRLDIMLSSPLQKVIIECKVLRTKGDGARMLKGYRKQLPLYLEITNAFHGYYVIFNATNFAIKPAGDLRSRSVYDLHVVGRPT